MSTAVTENERQKWVKPTTLKRNLLRLGITIAVLFVTILIVRNLFPTQPERGAKALLAKNYPEAMTLLLPIAGQGDAGAEYGVGLRGTIYPLLGSIAGPPNRDTRPLKLNSGGCMHSA